MKFAGFLFELGEIFLSGNGNSLERVLPHSIGTKAGGVDRRRDARFWPGHVAENYRIEIIIEFYLVRVAKGRLPLAAGRDFVARGVFP